MIISKVLSTELKPLGYIQEHEQLGNSRGLSYQSALAKPETEDDNGNC